MFHKYCCYIKRGGITTNLTLQNHGGYVTDPGGGGTRPENWWGCAAGRWKLDPKRSRKKLNLGPKISIFVKIGSFCTPKDSFAVGGWEKVPQKDRARSCQSEKRGSKPRHICITHHIGSAPPPPPPGLLMCQKSQCGHMEHGLKDIAFYVQNI